MGFKFLRITCCYSGQYKGHTLRVIMDSTQATHWEL